MSRGRTTKALHTIVALLFIVSVPLALITTNIRVAASEPHLYDFSTNRYGTTTSGIPADELKLANRQLISYFNDDHQRTIRVIINDDRGNQISLFNPRETAHLADVKNLFKKVFAIQVGAVVYALAFIAAVFIWAREASLRTLAKMLLCASGLTVIVIALTGVGALVGFDNLWARFHILAFTNDLWQLNPARDHLIQMFPEEFWQMTTLVIGAITILEAVVLAAIAGLYLRASNPQSGTPPASAPTLPLRPRTKT